MRAVGAVSYRGVDESPTQPKEDVFFCFDLEIDCPVLNEATKEVVRGIQNHLLRYGTPPLPQRQAPYPQVPMYFGGDVTAHHNLRNPIVAAACHRAHVERPRA